MINNLRKLVFFVSVALSVVAFTQKSLGQMAIGSQKINIQRHKKTKSGQLTRNVIVDHSNIDFSNEIEVRQLIQDIEDSGGKVLHVLPNKDIEVEYPTVGDAQRVVSESNNTQAPKDPKDLKLRAVIDYSAANPVKDLFDPASIKLLKRSKNLEGHFKSRVKIRKVKPNQVALARKQVDKILKEQILIKPTNKLPILSGETIIGYDNSNSQFFPPIGNQLSIGSCSAWAGGYYANTYTNAKTANVDLNTPAGENYLCSPAFIYPLVNGGIDEGSNLIMALEASSTYGCAPLNNLPYSNAFVGGNINSGYNPLSFPSVDSQKLALSNRVEMVNVIADYPLTATSLDTVKQALQNGDLVMTAISVEQGFMAYNGTTQSSSQYCSKTGSTKTFDYPNAVYSTYDTTCSGELGLHAIALVGYDDQKQAFKFSNSWGTGWGDNGYGWISYDLFKQSVFSVYYFTTLQDYAQDPVLKAYMVVNSELNQLPSVANKRVPVYYSANADFLNWDLSKVVFFPFFRFVGSEFKSFSMVHDVSNALIAGVPINLDSPLKLNSTLAFDASNSWWSTYLDLTNFLTIKDVRFFVVNSGVETELTPLSWTQTDKQEVAVKPFLAYPVGVKKIFVNTYAEITPAENTVLTADTVCSSTTLPQGLIINAATCVISGTPKVIKAVQTVSVKAVNKSGTSTAIVMIEVIPPAPQIAYAQSSFKVDRTATKVSIKPTTKLNVDSCTILPSLASGLLFSSTTCEISGKPNNILASKTYTVTALNKGSKVTTSFDLSIIEMPPVLEYANSFYSFTLGGTTMWTIKPTKLSPANATCSITGPNASSFTTLTGFSFQTSTCTISGLPRKVLPKTTFKISAKNSVSTADFYMDIEIKDIVPTITYAKTAYVYNQNSVVSIYTKTLKPVGVPCEISPTTLPAGVKFVAGNCSLSGRTTKASFPLTDYTVTAKNTAGESTFSFSLKVN